MYILYYKYIFIYLFILSAFFYWAIIEHFFAKIVLDKRNTAICELKEWAKKYDMQTMSSLANKEENYGGPKVPNVMANYKAQQQN